MMLSCTNLLTNHNHTHLMRLQLNYHYTWSEGYDNKSCLYILQLFTHLYFLTILMYVSLVHSFANKSRMTMTI